MPTLAVRLAEDGVPHVLDNTCETRGTTTVEIKALNDDQMLDERDPVVWQVVFAQPATVREITVGQLPDAAEEKVAWQPQPGGQLLAVIFHFDSGITNHTEFTLDQLKNGVVRYEYEYLTAEEFRKKQVSC
jgi:hypothetical protein